MRMSSKKSSEVSAACWPTFSRLRPRVKPGVRVSTRNSDTPREPAPRSVVAASTTRSACCPLEMKIFEPFTTYSSPSRRATVRMFFRSLPAPGSVMPMAATTSPDTIFGSQYCFCSSVPQCSR